MGKSGLEDDGIEISTQLKVKILKTLGGFFFKE